MYLDRFGKGPMHTVTFVNGVVITTLLRDVFTPAERAMVDAGRADSVMNTRVQWQIATNEMFRDAVADAAGRRVISVMSGFDVGNDLASEVFVLEMAVNT